MTCPITEASGRLNPQTLKAPADRSLEGPAEGAILTYVLVSSMEWIDG